jgi:hypothetical protein
VILFLVNAQVALLMQRANGPAVVAVAVAVAVAVVVAALAPGNDVHSADMPLIVPYLHQNRRIKGRSLPLCVY